MSEKYAGKGEPIDAEGLQAALDVLGASAAILWAVIAVETSGHGFLPDHRPVILFERHIFSKKTNHRWDDAQNADVSNPQPGGYGPAGAAQYERLARAAKLDPHAALLSASWGVGQVMGYHAGDIGFANVEDMVAGMSDSESVQLAAMARFIAGEGLDAALRSQDWARFARGYNGPNYRVNNYDTRLASEYEKFKRGGLPDLIVRAAQTYLAYLNYDTRGIDGVMGRFTRAALNDYQARKCMAVTDQVDDATFAALVADAQALQPVSA